MFISVSACRTFVLQICGSACIRSWYGLLVYRRMEMGLGHLMRGLLSAISSFLFADLVVISV